MPFIDTPDPIIGNLTDLGRTNFARALLGEVSFEVRGFAVGRGGYNDTNPVKIKPLNTSLLTLEAQVFPPVGIAPIVLIEYISPKTFVANCRLGSSEAVSSLGEIGLWAEIVYSSVDPGEVGTQFLMAIGHFPIIAKTLRQEIVFRIIIQF